MRTRSIREAAASKDGLPRRAYAYAPDADPATWKMPFLKADGTIDEDRLPGAVAALSPGGYRGQKADIPAAALPMVKARLRAAYRKWKGSDAEYPATISEAFYDGTCYSCNHPTACDCTDCPCASHVDESLADVASALDALEDLYALYAGEVADGDVAGADLIQQAIDAVLRFIPVEGREIGKPAGAMAMAESDPETLLAIISEAGKRNATSDQKMIQTIHDHTHDLGAQHVPDRIYQGMSESADVVTPTGDAGLVSFSESGEDAVYVMLSEAAATFDDATRTVTITPIKPGFGNKRDGFYYTKGALQEATQNGLFDGLKMFRNHPAKSEEKDRPERDVRDWFATTRKADWDEASGVPRLPVVVHEASDYQRWKDTPEQIAFSIRGGGYARPGSVNGHEAKIVESLARVRSVDWVTEAGAGGAITFAESAAEEFDMDVKALTTEQLREELRLREADAAVAEPEVEGEKAEPEAAATPEAAAEPEAPEAAAVPETPEPEKAPEGYVSRDEFEAFKASFAKAAEVKEAAAKAVTAEISATTLPRGAKDVVAEKFAEAGWGEGFVYTDEPALRGAVKAELASAAKILGMAPKKPSPVKGLGGSETGEVSVSESIADRWATRWGPEAIPAPIQTVIRAEQMNGTPAVPVAEQRDEDPISGISEAAASVQERIAARMGI